MLKVRAFFIVMNEIQKTDTSVQVFNNSNFGELRAIGTWDNPWFCLVDVCFALEIENSRKVKARLRQDGVTSSYVTDSLGRLQETTFINEQNLYWVIMRSDKPKAGIFQDWVCGEVIPSIRKTGGYGKQMSKAEMRLMVFMDMQAEINRQSNVIKKQGKRITALLSQFESEKDARRERLLLVSQTRKDDFASWLESESFSGTVSMKEIHRRYSDYCHSIGAQCPNSSVLGKVMVSLGQERVRRAEGFYYIFGSEPCHES